jgi:HAD superfamily hydrolase (TIGR01549 family)
VFAGVIFDLDQTLVDSSPLKPFRDGRRWAEVYKRISSVRCYPGIPELLADLKRNELKVAIVTSSPETYCVQVISQFRWAVSARVCYHDTSRRKPFPDPMILALQRMRLLSEDVIAVGDDAGDIAAARAAGIRTAAAAWGAADRLGLKASGADFWCEDVNDVRKVLWLD